ncbi:hypothetical protein FH972_023091 [Carpinus fangiana]|uniref:WW domain-containing protein n=1 Tax=Carpinus fangiana TaxID=176857 RepID=A0A5N6KU61_9ROSI|nr:hypothetical protein FH972_023091 [Carpinus fangiana]
MLKSTHKSVSGPQQGNLPAGWTEHKAPTGHTYYYNAETKQSTYTRPVTFTPPVAQAPIVHPSYPTDRQSQFASTPASTNFARPAFEKRVPRRDHGANDRPKTKHAIPGCLPWLLVKTKLGRRFVHNPETGESLWKIPEDVMKWVLEYDIQSQRRKHGQPEKTETEHSTRIEPHQDERVEETNEHESTTVEAAKVEAEPELASDEEYEEVEVTDDEDAEGPSKRQKLSPAADEPDQAAELGEDDMAYQLAEMEALEADFDDDNAMNDAEDSGWTDADAIASFHSLLDDHAIDPFTTWASVLDAGHILDNARYTHLPTTRARRDAFATWSTAHIARARAAKHAHAKQDPRIPFLALLHAHASPKLFWPEFRRKHKRAPALRDPALPDRDRERLYREHAARLAKTPPAALVADLHALLRSVPPGEEWNAASSVHGALPAALQSDVRWISLPAARRDALVQEFIATQLPAPADAAAGGERVAAEARQKDQERREEALRGRREVVEEARRRQERDVRVERARMAEGEEERRRALAVGKGGLVASVAMGREEEQGEE